MTFIVRFLRFLFWVLVLSWVMRLLARLVNQMGIGTARSKPYVDVPNDTIAKKLVRDPVCGMHLSERLALPLRQGSDTVYFCSAECRETYLDGGKRFAANA